jgi:probable F420-dependent oxidoreductase
VRGRRPGVMLPGAVRPEAKDLARRAERAGCDALWILDTRREPYLVAAAALDATAEIEVGTNVAAAFARSPALTAAAAWDLSIWSGGRFILGLGSQVAPTLRARFGVTADHPGPRMRDYVSAVRSCFEAYASGQGRYHGAFYEIRQPVFQPGAEADVQIPPIYVAAVNPYMAGIAGACGDGFAAHSFTTERHLKEVLRPAVAHGAKGAGRSTPPVLLHLVVAPNRETAALQMSVYTVPSYRGVLDDEGLGEVADRVIGLCRDGRRAEAAVLIEEQYLDLLGVGLLEDVERLVVRWTPFCDRLCLSVPWFGLSARDQLAAAHQLIDAVQSMPS